MRCCSDFGYLVLAHFLRLGESFDSVLSRKQYSDLPDLFTS
jgi:hypothetical protein